MSYKQRSPLPVIEGGTNTSTFAHDHGVLVYEAGQQISINPGLSNQILKSSGVIAPPSFVPENSIGYTTTATAAGTTTLTVISTEQQFFTGTTTQTVVLPVTSTLSLGTIYRIVNNSTGIVTVNSSGGNLVQAMASGSSAIFTVIAITGTTAASWSVAYFPPVGPATNIAGGVANDIVYQSAPSTTGFISSEVNAVFTTDSTGFPIWKDYLPLNNLLVDGTTIVTNITTTVSQVGSDITAGTNSSGITNMIMGGDSYVICTNFGDNTFSWYIWDGTTFVPTGSPVATGTQPRSIVAYNIGGTPYVSICNDGGASFDTYSWTGSTFVSVGASVATGPNPARIVSYVISGVNYVSLLNAGANTFNTYSWNGSAYVSIGASVATGAVPTGLAAYTIGGVQYLSVSNYNGFSFDTFSWNGSAFVSIGSAIALGTRPFDVQAYTIHGDQYLSFAATSPEVIATYVWNGTTFVSAAANVACTGSPRSLAAYMVSGVQYVTATCFGTNQVKTFAWTGYSYIPFGTDLTTGAGPFGISAFEVSGQTYFAEVNLVAGSWGLFTLPDSNISVSPTYNAPTATSLAGGTANYVPYQSASGVTGFLSPSTSGFVLTSNGTGSAPSFQANPADGIITLSGNSGSATGATVTVSGSGVVTTSASGSTLGITSSAANTINATSGSATASTNAFTIVGAGTVSTSATGSTLTITGSGGGFTWNNVTGTSASAAINNGYIANNAGLVTITLPATAAVGSVISIQGSGAGLWRLGHNASQQIFANGGATTSGTGGQVNASSRYDSISVVCIVADTGWTMNTSSGNLNFV